MSEGNGARFTGSFRAAITRCEKTGAAGIPLHGRLVKNESSNTIIQYA
jgi:hypothetical protein